VIAGVAEIAWCRVSNPKPVCEMPSRRKNLGVCEKRRVQIFLTFLAKPKDQHLIRRASPRPNTTPASSGIYIHTQRGNPVILFPVPEPVPEARRAYDS
jgi:hypothetical protein